MFLGPVIVPHGKVEGGVLLERSLDLEVSDIAGGISATIEDHTDRN
jgi:hypothetical protein